MFRTRVLTVAALATALAAATPATAKGIKFTAGIVNADGTILAGSGFTSVRDSTGIYTITFPGGVFPTHAPAMTCNAFGITGSVPVCVIFGEGWSKTNPTAFEVRIYTPTGTHQDNQFQFTEITTR